MDILILLNKTVTNLWDKTRVQQIKAIIGAARPRWAEQPSRGARGEARSQAASAAVGGATTGSPGCWGGRGVGATGAGRSSSQGFQLQLRPGKMPPNAPSLAAQVFWAPVTSGDPPPQWTGKASFQTRLRTRLGPVPSPGRGTHGADAQAVPYHTHQELVPRACALHPQEGGACSWEGAHPGVLSGCRPHPPRGLLDAVGKAETRSPCDVTSSGGGCSAQT